jgi:hypothetical protein
MHPRDFSLPVTARGLAILAIVMVNNLLHAF